MKEQKGFSADVTAAEEQVSRVLGMNDAQLQAALRAVAQASGMSAKRTEALTRDPDAVRRKLSSIRPEDVQNMLARISPEQLAALTEQLQELKNKER